MSQPTPKPERKWKPRELPVQKLYADNQRLQRLNYVHRKELRRLHQKLESFHNKLYSYQVTLALMSKMAEEAGFTFDFQTLAKKMDKAFGASLESSSTETEKAAAEPCESGAI